MYFLESYQQIDPQGFDEYQFTLFLSKLVVDLEESASLVRAKGIDRFFIRIEKTKALWLN
jgi:hypothetical protein